MAEPVDAELPPRTRVAMRLLALGWTQEQIAKRLSGRRLTTPAEVGTLLADARSRVGCENDIELALWYVDSPLFDPQERAKWVENAKVIYEKLLALDSAIVQRTLELVTSPEHCMSAYTVLLQVLAAEFPEAADRLTKPRLSQYMSRLYDQLGGTRSKTKLVVVCHLARA